MQELTVAEIKANVGNEVGISKWFDVSQETINAFADITHDHQFIHIDPERAAKETPFGGAIAHGFLTLSLMSAMSYDAAPKVKGAKMGVNYGFEKLRFLNPVAAGKRVRGRFTIQSADERKPGEITTTYLVTVDIEGEDKPALVAEWIGRAYYDAA